MSRALELAALATTLSSPNPRVGCVLLPGEHGAADDGRAEGFTQQAGGPHAEVMALRDVAARGLSVKGATAYVTMEPCSHFGRTPPCCHALIDAGVARVVVALLDPNPLVSGRGVQMLREAGIAVEVLPADSPAAVASRELNIGFFSRMLRKTPWVRMKVATSLDGATALADGTSQWITGEAARADGHAWRARACAVLTGIGTVLQDDPLLDVRQVDTPRQPHLVIVDSRLETPLDAKLWSTLGKQALSGEKFGLSQQAMDSIASRAIFIYAAERNDAKKQALEARGATVIYLPELDHSAALNTNADADANAKPNTKLNPNVPASPSTSAGSPTDGGAPARQPSPGGPPGSKVDLRAMLQDLGQREINELHVEAGFKLNGSLLKAGLVDELLLYTAPKLLGPGMGIANLPALGQLGDAVQLDFSSAQLIGADLRVVARVRGHGQF